MSRTRPGRLLPGAYAQVHFDVPVNGRRLTVPSSAMLFRSEGPCVAVVGPGDRVELRPIVIGRDFGTTLEILQGLRANDRVVENPPDSLESGQAVQRCRGWFDRKALMRRAYPRFSCAALAGLAVLLAACHPVGPIIIRPPRRSLRRGIRKVPGG